MIWAGRLPGPAGYRSGRGGSTPADKQLLGADDRSTSLASPAATAAAGARVPVMTGASVVARQRERFGVIKVGSAFFGWLTATGIRCC